MSCYDALPAAVGALAAAIAEGRSDNDVALLAALFTQLGDSLAMILAGRSCVQCTATPEVLPLS